MHCRPALPVFIRSEYELDTSLTPVSTYCLLVSYQLLKIVTSALNKNAFFPSTISLVKMKPPGPPNLCHHHLPHIWHEQCGNLATVTVHRGMSGHFSCPQCCLYYLPRHIPCSLQTAGTHTLKKKTEGIIQNVGFEHLVT